MGGVGWVRGEKQGVPFACARDQPEGAAVVLWPARVEIVDQGDLWFYFVGGGRVNGGMGGVCGWVGG